MSRTLGLCVIQLAAVVLISRSTLASPTDKCWSSWTNDNQPTDGNNRTDRETVTPDQSLQKLCPSTYGVECKDNGGEAFTGSPDRSTSHYAVSCNLTHGLTCTPFIDFMAKNYTCPDFFIRSGCSCPATTTVTSNKNGVTMASSGNGNKKVTTAAGTPSTASNGHQATNAPSGNGNNKVTTAAGTPSTASNGHKATHQGGGNGGTQQRANAAVYCFIVLSVMFKSV